MSKKTLEQLEKEVAEEKAKARAASKERQERLRELWDLNKHQKELKGAKNATERRRIELELKTQKLGVLHSTFKKLVSGRTFKELRELIQIVFLQEQQIEYLSTFRR